MERRGVASPRRDSVSLGGAVAEGFDGTLTSGKSWPPGGKAPKETITNARRKQLCGSCVELPSSEKMSVGPCEGT